MVIIIMTKIGFFIDFSRNRRSLKSHSLWGIHIIKLSALYRNICTKKKDSTQLLIRFQKKYRSTFLDRVLFKKHGPESNGSRQVLQNSFSMPKISLFFQQFRSFSCSKFPKLKNCSMLRSSFGGLAGVCRFLFCF